MSAHLTKPSLTQRWEQLWVWGAPEDIRRGFAAVEEVLGDAEAAKLSFQDRRDLWVQGHWVGVMFDWRLLSGPDHTRARVGRFWRALQGQPGLTMARVAGGKGRTCVRCFGASVNQWRLPIDASHHHDGWARAVASHMQKEWRLLRNNLPRAPEFQRAALNESGECMLTRWSGVTVQPDEVEAWWEFMARFLHRRAAPSCHGDSWGPPTFQPPVLFFNPVTGQMDEVGLQPDTGLWSPLAFYQEETLRALARALPPAFRDLPRLNTLIGPGLFDDGEQRLAVFEPVLETPLLEHAGPEEFWNLRRHRLDFGQLASFAVVDTFKQLSVVRQFKELDAAYAQWQASPAGDLAVAIMPMLHAGCPSWPHWLALLEGCAPERSLVGAEDLLALLDKLRVEDRQKRMQQALPVMPVAPEAARL